MAYDAVEDRHPGRVDRSKDVAFVAYRWQLVRRRSSLATSSYGSRGRSAWRRRSPRSSSRYACSWPGTRRDDAPAGWASACFWSACCSSASPARSATSIETRPRSTAPTSPVEQPPHDVDGRVRAIGSYPPRPPPALTGVHPSHDEQYAGGRDEERAAERVQPQHGARGERHRVVARDDRRAVDGSLDPRAVQLKIVHVQRPWARVFELDHVEPFVGPTDGAGHRLIEGVGQVDSRARPPGVRLILADLDRATVGRSEGDQEANHDQYADEPADAEGEPGARAQLATYRHRGCHRRSHCSGSLSRVRVASCSSCLAISFGSRRCAAC